VKILRTIIWVLAALGFLVFAIYNWQPVELRLWQNLVLETKVPVLALLAFAAGFLPMWAVHRSMMWSMSRRVRTLENSLKNTAMAHRADAGGAVGTPPFADNPVEKPGKSGGDEPGPFDISDTGGASSGSADAGGSAGE
jgi:lipopolysaccharide assembly protein A